MFEYVVSQGSASDSLSVIRDGKLIGLIRRQRDIVSYYPRSSRIPSLNASTLHELQRMLEIVEKSEWSVEQRLIEGAMVSGDRSSVEQAPSNAEPQESDAKATEQGSSSLSDDQRLLRRLSGTNGR
jgi:hypothetical protein